MSSVLKNLLSQKMTNGYLVPAQSTKLGLLLDSLLPGGLTGKKGYVTKQAKNILFCCAMVLYFVQALNTPLSQ